MKMNLKKPLFFPSSKQLDKKWWHRLVKVVSFPFYYLTLISLVCVLVIYLYGGLSLVVMSNKNYKEIKLYKYSRTKVLTNEEYDSKVSEYPEFVVGQEELNIALYREEKYIPYLSEYLYDRAEYPTIFQRTYWSDFWSMDTEGFLDFIVVPLAFGGWYAFFLIVYRMILYIVSGTNWKKKK